MDEELPLNTINTLQTLGLLRVLNSLNDPYDGLPFDEETKGRCWSSPPRTRSPPHT